MQAAAAGNLKVYPRTSFVCQQPSVFVLDHCKCHRDQKLQESLKQEANMDTILTPGGLTAVDQPYDPMFKKEMKRGVRGKYTTWSATNVADPKTGKFKPPGRSTV